ncbi:hypothetical protein Tco_1041617 [Tanacetum coccineum]|uniref:Uncharacterized protein n=1 Tax=Tanacetum coccineum TaxID=301880 RepID=A0ABQ5GIX9_9ASTR
MPILYSFEENKLEYEDEDEVKIKMMGTGMDKESLEHNLYEDDITPIICHNFSPTSNPPIKLKDYGSFRMKVVEPLTIHTPPSPHVVYLYQNGYILREEAWKFLGSFIGQFLDDDLTGYRMFLLHY